MDGDIWRGQRRGNSYTRSHNWSWRNRCALRDRPRLGCPLASAVARLAWTQSDAYSLWRLDPRLWIGNSVDSAHISELLAGGRSTGCAFSQVLSPWQPSSLCLVSIASTTIQYCCWRLPLGAMTVAARRRAWRTVCIILGIGMLAAASLLPYAPMMRRKDEWTFMLSYPADFPWLWKRICEVIGSPDPLGVWLWLGLFAVGVGVIASVALSQLWKRKPASSITVSRDPDQSYSVPDAVLFAAVALVVGVLGYAVFLRALNYYTQPWYYITLVAFAACTLEILFGAWPLTPKPQILPLLLRRARVAVAVALLCFTGWANLGGNAGPPYKFGSACRPAPAPRRRRRRGSGPSMGMCDFSRPLLPWTSGDHHPSSHGRSSSASLRSCRASDDDSRSASSGSCAFGERPAVRAPRFYRGQPTCRCASSFTHAAASLSRLRRRLAWRRLQ